MFFLFKPTKGRYPRNSGATNQFRLAKVGDSTLFCEVMREGCVSTSGSIYRIVGNLGVSHLKTKRTTAGCLKAGGATTWDLLETFPQLSALCLVGGRCWGTPLKGCHSFSWKSTELPILPASPEAWLGAAPDFEQTRADGQISVRVTQSKQI